MQQQHPSPALEPPTGTPWMPVARLLRPQGRRGELLAESLSDLPGLFRPGTRFALGALPNPQVPASLGTTALLLEEEAWLPQGRNAGRLVLKFAGVDSISAAEALEGRQLLLPETELPPLAPDTYLVRDLLGCTVFDGERLLGTVVDLHFPVGPDGRSRLTEAVDLLALAPAGAPPETEPVLIPFVKAWLAAVDLEQRRISMHLPPGLLE